MSSSGQSASARSSPALPNGKASAAPPKLTEEGMEMKDIHNNAKPSLPIEEDLMQLARMGEIGAIQRLFEKGKFSATYKDEEGITPLHWAAINNQYALCKFLLESGADVNAKGGESVATPAMWAAQRCHYYVVNLLLHHGADPLLTDVQGYNILHLATFDGNVFLLVVLLQQLIPVDVQDPQGHTCLMWAAYKGYPACVDLFLRWGANVNFTDENGFTALHWALVHGSQPCIKKLVEYGSDRFAATSTAKTPAQVAQEMKSRRAWYKALAECGYNEDATPKTLPLGLGRIIKDRSVMSKFFFLWPFLTIFFCFTILSKMVIYAAVPIAIVTALAMQMVPQTMGQWGPPEFRVLHRTPFLSGVFAGTLFWVGIRWLLTILPNTFSSHPFLNILFGICYGFCSYFYLYSMFEDPGYVPKLGSRNQQKSVIEELFGLWKFDEENFCVQCMIRKPLRSKHCFRCKRCVAKHDHHCPWIHNCVGANNHRHFFLYILFMQLGIIIFINLVLDHLSLLTPPPPEVTCNILSTPLCHAILPDPFTVVLALWTSLQLIWVTMLLIVQLVQIARAQTTYENMRGHDVLSGSDSAAAAITSALATGSTSLAGGGLGPTGMGPNPNISHSHPHPKKKSGFFNQWKKLLGLDTFVATAQDARAGSRGRRQNAFSRGILTNCRDFWCDPAPYFGKRENGQAMLGGEVINYGRLYDVPLRLSGGATRRRGEGMEYRRLAGGDEDEGDGEV